MRDLALVQTGLPLLMIGWLILGRTPTKIDLVLRMGTAWAMLLGVWLAGIWLAMPLATVAVLAVLLLLASLVAWRRTGPPRQSGRLEQGEHRHPIGLCRQFPGTRTSPTFISMRSARGRSRRPSRANRCL